MDRAVADAAGTGKLAHLENGGRTVAELLPVKSHNVPPSGEWPACLGDCDGDSLVSIDDLISLVNLALENQPISACTAGDRDFDRRTAMEELVAAVRAALEGCSDRAQGPCTRDQEVGDGRSGR